MKRIALAILLFAATAAAYAQSPLGVAKAGHGPAVIFIPGLYCSGDVWKETVDHLKDRYTCYSLTLPGFAGQAPAVMSDSLLTGFAEAIISLIRTEGLQRPILVGHSLGGWLALRVETRSPGIAGGLVVVSSAPFLPALSMGDSITLDSARAIGAQIKRYMGMQTLAQAAAGSRAAIRFMIRDSVRVAEVAAMADRSDGKTQGEVMYELFSTDLRPEMGRVRCPILVLGDWVSYKGYGATRENTLGKYRRQFALASSVTIALNDSSRHFIMYDEPDWLDGQVDAFLRTTAAR